MTNTPLRTLRIDDDLWKQVKVAAAKEGTDVSSWVRAHLRAALRAMSAVFVAVLAILTLGACGGQDDATLPAAERSASPAPSVTVTTSEPVAAESEPVDECWTDPTGDPTAWQNVFNEISGDPVRAVAFLESLPATSAGCGDADRASLAYAEEVAGEMRERFPDLF